MQMSPLSSRTNFHEESFTRTSAPKMCRGCFCEKKVGQTCTPVVFITTSQSTYSKPERPVVTSAHLQRPPGPSPSPCSYRGKSESRARVVQGPVCQISVVAFVAKYLCRNPREQYRAWCIIIIGSRESSIELISCPGSWNLLEKPLRRRRLHTISRGPEALEANVLPRGTSWTWSQTPIVRQDRTL